ncbi:MAG: hypothetical protein Q7R83_01765 [bacterium]|nr:hypothetical protein [bacterium]
MPTNEPTIQDVLDVLHTFAEQVDGRFSNLEQDAGLLKSEVAGIKSTMVTKDYLDEKLGDLRGELVSLARKQNVKFEVLVDGLVEQGSLKKTVAQKVLAMEPFPKT